MRLKAIVEDSDTSAGWWFDLTVQVLIIVSLFSFSIETLPDLPPHVHRVLRIIESVTVCIFSLEYLTRVWVADNKLKYMFSFFGIIDFASIVPFYLPGGVDLRSLRVLRLLRAFRLFKLLRYNQAMKRFSIAIGLIREELILFSIVTSMMFYISAVGIYYFENTAQPEVFDSIFTSLWWAIVTLTTVGYGDIYPITLGGRIFTFFVLMGGLGVVAVPAGLFSSALSEARRLSNSDKTNAVTSETTT
ncbi:ion transporter [Aeoliella mucimassa]|uniref:Cyclic nucleotide-gated potassium channel n=1 Tax=Aeoliella mucimassa TaxID=2527972 RepID=A0A518AQ01_9BACT|nr:ion transporter [Aeoliella mucimassa]QDU56797.1 Cyclic nucleotide-gated potassium channel [Aeoliella mucimassa]